jgi:hypothetical protein
MITYADFLIKLGAPDIPYSENHIFSSDYQPCLTGLKAEQKRIAIAKKLLELDSALAEDGMEKSSAMPAVIEEQYGLWLRQPGVPETLMSFLVRPQTSGTGVRSSRHRLDLEASEEELPAHRLSFNLAQMFLRWEEKFATFVICNMEVIVAQLFLSLEANSEANLFHFSLLLRALLRSRPRLFMQVFLDNLHVYLPPLLANLHEPGVADSILALLTVSDAELRTRLYIALERHHFFHSVARRIVHETCNKCSYAADFLHRIMEELAPLTCSDTLFAQLAGSSVVVDLLSIAASSPRQTKPEDILRKNIAIEALSKYCEAATRKHYEVVTGTHEEWGIRLAVNHCSIVADSLHSFLEPHVEALVAEFVRRLPTVEPPTPRIKYAGFTLERALSYHVMLLLEILSIWLSLRPDVASFRSFTGRFWTAAVDLYLLSPHTSILHTSFFRLLTLAARNRQMALLRCLLLDQHRLLRRWIDWLLDSSFPSHRSDRGFILNLLAVMRTQEGLEKNLLVQDTRYVELVVPLIDRHEHDIHAKLLPRDRPVTPTSSPVPCREEANQLRRGSKDAATPTASPVPCLEEVSQLRRGSVDASFLAKVLPTPAVAVRTETPAV